MFPISHLFVPFNKNPSFCFHYILEESCYLCNTNKKNTDYSNIINAITENNLNDSIENFIIKKFQVTISICPKCAYDKKGIIGEPFGSYVKIFKNIIYPKFIVFFIDFGDINENSEQIYSQLSKNCNKIINFLKPFLNISNNIYELKGLICLESPYHFIGYLINLEKDIYDLKKNFNYIHDGLSLDHNIIQIDDYRKNLLQNIPYVALYVKNI